MKKEWLVKNLTIVIVVLFISSGIVSAISIDDKSKHLNNGYWLYVGGFGEGNYSKIQDAIDNASEGDTVFVYDDSSPYLEIITVNKSITIQGENMKTTTIGRDLWGEDDYLTIISDYVTITNFTFNGSKSAGIWCEDVSNIIIEYCVFYSNIWGVAVRGNIKNTVIRNCSFFSNHINGIQFSGLMMKNNEVSYCDFFENGGPEYEGIAFPSAILIWPAQGLKIHHCNIIDNWKGLVLSGLFIKNIDIRFNNIFNNDNNSDYVGVFFRTLPLHIYASQNWWGTPKGPNIYWMNKFIRDVDSNETILFSWFGFHIYPWLSEPAGDTGQHPN